MTKQYLGNIITPTPTPPANRFTFSGAPGIWSLDEAFAYNKAGLWPTPGNFPVYVEDVFSTYLYEGNGTSQTITNGIDLDGEGGLVWIKSRSDRSNKLFDTERGALNRLITNSTAGQVSETDTLSSFNSDGFTVLSDASCNENTKGHASWTFRKAPKFFDVVTYTGTGSAQTISHNLGSVPGVIIVKVTAGRTDSWIVYHRSQGATEYAKLDTTDTFYTGPAAATTWDTTEPTSSVFTVGTDGGVNQSGATYVAYLFAHNDGDGEFGPDGDADIIKCGSFTTDGSGLASVDLGFEPQWILIRPSSTAASWLLVDTMRGMAHSDLKLLLANSDSSELDWTHDIVPTATGFDVVGNIFNQNTDVIYIAIRRGPMAVPESADEVFDIDLANPGSSTITTPFPVDLSLGAKRSGSAATFSAVDRLRSGKSLRTNAQDAEQNVTVALDSMDSFNNQIFGSGDHLFYSLKRAPKFFDVVAYTGDGVVGRTVSHNLGVAPGMMWVKRRDATTDWKVYHGSYLTSAGWFRLNVNSSGYNSSRFAWNNTHPTDTNFTVDSHTDVNASGGLYIAYLFAELPGISKLGHYIGNGTSQTIDCGFTSGARFVLVKYTRAGLWYVWDTERGIVAGNDPYLDFSSTAAEVTTTDFIDPHNSGFIVNGTSTNESGDDYIFWAIA